MNPTTKTPKQLHQEATQAFTEALYLERLGKHPNELMQYALQALKAEWEAISILDAPEYQYARPTLALLCQSAATMAIFLGKYGKINAYSIAIAFLKKGLETAEDSVLLEELKTMMNELKTFLADYYSSRMKEVLLPLLLEGQIEIITFPQEAGQSYLPYMMQRLQAMG